MPQRKEGERTAAGGHHRRTAARAKTGRARKSARRAVRAVESSAGAAKPAESEAHGQDAKLYKKSDPRPDPDLE